MSHVTFNKKPDPAPHTGFKVGQYFCRPQSGRLAVVVCGYDEDLYGFVILYPGAAEPYCLKLDYTKQSLLEVLIGGEWQRCDVSIQVTPE